MDTTSDHDPFTLVANTITWHLHMAAEHRRDGRVQQANRHAAIAESIEREITLAGELIERRGGDEANK